MMAAMDPAFASSRAESGRWHEALVSFAKALWPWRAAEVAEAAHFAREKRARLARIAALERMSNEAISGPSGLLRVLLQSRLKTLRRVAESYQVRRLKRLQFDEHYYLQSNGDVKGDFRRAALHFIRHGRTTRRNARFVLTTQGWAGAAAKARP
jgi:hypothetical protein